MPTRLKRHDEPGHVHFWTLTCCERLTFFWHDDVKRVVVDGLHKLQAEHGVCLVAYVIMPEHLHIVLYPHTRGKSEPIPISTLLHSFKQHIGFHGKECLRQLWRTKGRLWSQPLDDWARGARDKQTIMHPRGYDFNITKHQTLLEKIDYCHKNPITRELVSSAEDYRWSSYRFYELDDSTPLRMDWDGQWPIVW
jgi:REP-associated tyrosine transposase